MADSAVFEWVCSVLEKSSAMNRMQARGTIRLVLTGVGLETTSLTARQLKVVATKLLPKELKLRGIANAEAICAELAACPPSVELDAARDRAEQPEDVFHRLGRKT